MKKNNICDCYALKIKNNKFLASYHDFFFQKKPIKTQKCIFLVDIFVNPKNSQSQNKIIINNIVTIIHMYTSDVKTIS